MIYRPPLPYSIGFVMITAPHLIHFCTDHYIHRSLCFLRQIVLVDLLDKFSRFLKRLSPYWGISPIPVRYPVSLLRSLPFLLFFLSFLVYWPCFYIPTETFCGCILHYGGNVTKGLKGGKRRDIIRKKEAGGRKKWQR